ncbi:MAG: TetR/AcrR family transcriptional regulator [Treponema sp.]|nr:TetR/AcrR family transcriptional regulator [Treponema sp.]
MNQSTTEENRIKLLTAAKKEFLEKGFLNASLRTICKNAGMTTGAVYFFFKDKEALFSALIKKHADSIYELLCSHITAEKEMLEEEKYSNLEKGKTNISDIMKIYFQHDNEMADDMIVGQKVFDIVYGNYDLTLLLLSKSQGTEYENFIDKLISMSEKHIFLYCSLFCNLLGMKEIKPYVVHWLSHLMINTYISLFLHIKDKNEAIEHLPVLMKSLQAAFFSIFSDKPLFL